MGHVLYTIILCLLILSVLPLVLLLGVLAVIMSGFPIIFSQRRVGKNGAVFTMYKFRTMIPNAEALKRKYESLNESTGPVFKIHRDPRFHAIGRFLSHTGLDELPQLVNLMRGEMALIGPRPLPISEARHLKPWMRERHRILPGIISPAILTGKYHQDFDGWMRSDVSYVRSKHVMGDLFLLIRFIPFMGMLLLRALTPGVR